MKDPVGAETGTGRGGVCRTLDPYRPRGRRSGGDGCGVAAGPGESLPLPVGGGRYGRRAPDPRPQAPGGEPRGAVAGPAGHGSTTRTQGPTFPRPGSEVEDSSWHGSVRAATC